MIIATMSLTTRSIHIITGRDSSTRVQRGSDGGTKRSGGLSQERPRFQHYSSWINLPERRPLFRLLRSGLFFRIGGAPSYLARLSSYITLFVPFCLDVKHLDYFPGIEMQKILREYYADLSRDTTVLRQVHTQRSSQQNAKCLWLYLHESPR